jgi:hypothetical protein
MWTSPDIWVRNQDDGIPQHENPELGQRNYIHVEVRNRSTVTAASVPVAVYVANASVGLTWPAQWTLVGTATVTNVPAGGSAIAKVTWSPSGTGHFCLVARLLAPDDPMTFPETADITYNTRQNNNVVWRNVNVINLIPGTSRAGKATAARTKPNSSSATSWTRTRTSCSNSPSGPGTATSSSPAAGSWSPSRPSSPSCGRIPPRVGRASGGSTT